MDNLVNIFIAVATPFLICSFLVEKRERVHLVSILAGFTAAFLTGYVNSFFAALFGMDVATATQNVTPVVEEVMKLLPVLFFALGFAEEKRQIWAVAIEIGLGFSIMENSTYLVSYGADNLAFVIVRGLATGVLHPFCLLVSGIGACALFEEKRFALLRLFAFTCAAMMMHGMYNLLVGAEQMSFRLTGCFLPLVFIILFALFQKKYWKDKSAWHAS